MLAARPALAVPAGEGGGPAGTSTTVGDAVPGQIIPEPNTGRPPEEPGDRGGWQQFLVLAVVVGGIGLIAGLVWRDSRRRRGPADTAD